MTVNQMRSALVEAYPTYRFGDYALYSDRQIVGIYRDKKPKMPRYQMVPVGLVLRDGIPTMVMERQLIG